MTAPTTTREAKADPEARRRVPSRPTSRPGGRSSRGNSPRTSPPNEAKTKNEKRPPCRGRSPSGGGCAKRPALGIRRQSFESIELVLALAAKAPTGIRLRKSGPGASARRFAPRRRRCPGRGQGRAESGVRKPAPTPVVTFPGARGRNPYARRALLVALTGPAHLSRSSLWRRRWQTTQRTSHFAISSNSRRRATLPAYPPLILNSRSAGSR